MEAPPSTSIAVPVMNDESSDARYSTERASSSEEATSERVQVGDERLRGLAVVHRAASHRRVDGAQQDGVEAQALRSYSAASACVSPTRPDLLAA